MIKSKKDTEDSRKMEVIILKYVQLVCIMIFMRNNSDCPQYMSRSEEMNNLKVAACAANCLNETNVS